MVNDGRWLGWIDRKGNLIPCEFGKHVTCLERLAMTEVMAEKEGWVKVTVEHDSHKYKYIGMKRFSEDQVHALTDLGFTEVDVNILSSF